MCRRHEGLRSLILDLPQAVEHAAPLLVLDEFRPKSPKDAGQLGAMLEFYFALTSQPGTWAVEEISAW